MDYALGFGFSSFCIGEHGNVGGQFHHGSRSLLANILGRAAWFFSPYVDRKSKNNVILWSSKTYDLSMLFWGILWWSCNCDEIWAVIGKMQIPCDVVSKNASLHSLSVKVTYKDYIVWPQPDQNESALIMSRNCQIDRKTMALHVLTRTRISDRALSVQIPTTLLGVEFHGLPVQCHDNVEKTW